MMMFLILLLLKVKVNLLDKESTCLNDLKFYSLMV